jgi:16S rRNA (cytosine967-C5)-methyltransferase
VRRKEQAAVLDRAASLVRPGGRIVYITCSILPEENDDALSDFLERNAGFKPIPPADMLAQAGLGELSAQTRATALGLQMTPRKTATDGFFVAILQRAS